MKKIKEQLESKKGTLKKVPISSPGKSSNHDKTPVVLSNFANPTIGLRSLGNAGRYAARPSRARSSGPPYTYYRI